jgi:hypothetical protein
MAQLDFADWNPISHGFNKGLMRDPIRGLVVHITAGHGALPIVKADFDRPEKRASAHFGIDKEGDMWQFVDTDDRAWAIDGDSHDAQWLSVENVAVLGEQLTTGQLYGCALLLEWLHDEHDVPFELTTHASGRGLGYHKMFHIGDHACPGPVVVGQLESIRRWAWYLWYKDTGDPDTPNYIKHFRD